jgi:hypothetical protein
MIANKHLPSWFECDFLSISRADFITEFEIKLSRNDFRRDFKDKFIKHEWLKGNRGELLIESNMSQEKIVESFDPNFVGIQRTIKMDEFKGPNYFNYICPENLIKLEEVPEYAGLIYVRNNDFTRIKIIKPAPKIHKNKVLPEVKESISTRYMYEYWKQFYAK